MEYSCYDLSRNNVPNYLISIRYYKKVGNLYFQIYTSIFYDEISNVYQVGFSTMLVDESDTSKSYLFDEKEYVMTEKTKQIFKRFIGSGFEYTSELVFFFYDIYKQMLEN